jgi:hypothetical protein
MRPGYCVVASQRRHLKVERRKPICEFPDAQPARNYYGVSSMCLADRPDPSDRKPPRKDHATLRQPSRLSGL